MLSTNQLLKIVLLVISMPASAGFEEKFLSCNLTTEMFRDGVSIRKAERVETLVLYSEKDSVDFIIKGGGLPFFDIFATNIQSNKISNLQDKSWAAKFDVVFDLSQGNFDSNIKFSMNRLTGDLMYEFKPQNQTPQLLQKSYGKCIVREGKLF